MSVEGTSIAEEAERLPVTDRIALVERLLESLSRSDPVIDRAWAEVAEQRLDAYLDGRSAAAPAGAVLAKHLRR